MTTISRPPQRVICDASNKPASSATAFNLSASGVTGFLLPVNSSEVTSGDAYIWLAEEIDGDGNPSGAWQTFEGVYTDAATDTVSQDTLLQSSTGSFIDWSGTGVDALARLTCIDLAINRPTTIDITTATTVEIGEFRSGSNYLILITGLKIDTDNRGVRLEMYDESGAAWSTANVDLSGAWQSTSSLGTASEVNAGFINLTYATLTLGNATGEALNSTIHLFDPRGAGKTAAITQSPYNYYSGGSEMYINANHYFEAADGHSKARLSLSGSGNFTAGKVLVTEYAGL